jgi:hypothetical protein
LTGQLPTRQWLSRSVTPLLYAEGMVTADGETPFWTNPSVLDFAGGEDPVDAITLRARDIVFDAVQAGWHGPPFDPLVLARRLGIEVVARDDLSDARVLAYGDRLRIEFNPTRPRGRLRYSVAHEIVHTFFTDVGNEVRHRTAMGAVDDGGSGDDWQLEMLCNIAAGELLVPSIALPPDELDDAVLNIERLMALRAAFDVSSEAILRRAAQATTHPVTMFAAARLRDGWGEPLFRLDYSVRSRGWDAGLPRGLHFDSKVLSLCTAVGYTAAGVERWNPYGPELAVAAAGIPPYPGQSLPRVAGLLLRDAPVSTGPTISHVAGDATDPRGDGPRVIAHVVNDAARTWGGGGFAIQLGRRLPQAAQAFRAWTIAGPDNLRLGHTHVVDAHDITVASMVAQEGYGMSEKPRIRYHALAECLASVRDAAQRREATVHMPRIGIGQGRGTWALIEDEIDRALCAHGVDVTVYTRPGEHHDLTLARGRGER